MTAFDLAFEQRAGKFTLQIGEIWTAPITGIFGPSGSGKSTLLEVLLGLRPPASTRGAARVGNTVLFDDKQPILVPPHARGLGWVPQDAALFPHLSVRDNTTFARRPGGAIDGERLAKLAALCEIDHILDRRPAALSGGERQRASLARALYGARGLLLLDEPFASLDLKRRRRLLVSLREHAAAERLSLLYVSHDWAEVEMLCTYALVLNGGRVVQRGAPQNLNPY